MKKLILPYGISFSDLHISRDPVTLEIEFDIGPLEQLLSYNGINKYDEDSICAILIAWYHYHLASGGHSDFVFEQIRSEIEAEDKYGAKYAICKC